MNEVEKMRSSQLADMSVPEIQVKLSLIHISEVTETEVIVPDPDIAPRTVFFKIGSAEVSPREAMNEMCIRDRA